MHALILDCGLCMLAKAFAFCFLRARQSYGRPTQKDAAPSWLAACAHKISCSVQAHSPKTLTPSDWVHSCCRTRVS